MRKLDRIAYRRYPEPTTTCPTERRIMNRLRERFVQRFRERFKRIYKTELP